MSIFYQILKQKRNWVAKLNRFQKNRFLPKVEESNVVFGIIILLILFWPIMSTGSFLKNWNMIFICYLLGITLRINSINFKNFFKNEE